MVGGVTFSVAHASPPDKTVLVLEALARRGSTRAQFELARRFETGIGTSPNSTKAFDFYCKAAAKGHPMAAYRLGSLFLAGKGVKRDDVMAESWFRRSIELGYPEARDMMPRFGSIKNLPVPYCYTASKPLRIREPEPERTPSYVLIGSGSGFYVNDRELVTNHHVIDDCAKVTVEKESGSTAADVIAVDKKLDLAVLRTSVKHPTHARIREDAGVLGESVFLFGYPQRPLLESINMTNGIVSSMTGFRGNKGQLQTSAAAQKGNSGGPLVDATGSVIGVITAVLRDSQNVGFAVKNTTLVDFLDNHKISFSNLSVQTVSATDVAKEVQDFTFPIACYAKR
jgi:S1-C subfamily serine protease